MNKVILQPSGNKDAREHYNDTIKNSVSIDKIKKFLTLEEFKILKEIYPENNCKIWGVTPGGNNITKWQRISKGDVTLFSNDGRIYASAITTHKLHNKDLAASLWDYNDKGQTWEYVYFLDEVRSHNIPYLNFNKAVGYKENYIIQGFGVLDEDKSKKVFEEFGLESSTYIQQIDEKKYSEIVLSLPETEQEFTSKRRLEQGFLRKKLFNNNTSGVCSCCGKKYPVSMLWCSHIKKRSKCSEQEKRDFNIVLPMCRFGCDELFEKGYISVNKEGIIFQVKEVLNMNVKDYIDKLVNKKCSDYHNLNSKYFEWHREFHK